MWLRKPPRPSREKEKQVSKSVNAKRMIGLVVLVVVAALVVLVAALYAPDAEAKKNKPQFNVVQCPTGANGLDCIGTATNDFLIGGPADRPRGAVDVIGGGEGNDVYLFPSTKFSDDDGDPASISDRGGGGDVVGLSSYGIEDFEVSRDDIGEVNELVLDGPGERDIDIFNFFDGGFFEGKIETFLFREGLFTGDELASKATEATPEEQAALQERLPEDERSVRDVDSQESKRSEQTDAVGSPQTK